MNINHANTLDLLDKLVQFPSIAAKKTYYADMVACIEFLATEFQRIGCDTQILYEQDAPPLLIATYKVGDTKPWVGVYHHYDVQPEGDRSLWQSDPFKLHKHDGKLFGRGTADNKGPLVQSIVAIEALIKTNALSSNLMVMVEGEEEAGSKHFPQYMEKAYEHIKKLSVLYVPDEYALKLNQARIVHGMKGTASFGLTIEVGKNEVHSGIYSNVTYNPVHIVSEIISSLQDIKTGKILIPQFYNDVRQITKDDISLLQQTSDSNAQIRRDGNFFIIRDTVMGHDISIARKLLPSFDVNGINAGYYDEEIKPIIPTKVVMKLSFRIVEYQQPENIHTMLEKFIINHIPEGVYYNLEFIYGWPAFYKSDTDTWIQKTNHVFTRYFKQKPAIDRSGGSNCAISRFSEAFPDISVVPFGFFLASSNIHAANEHYDEDIFWQGIDALQFLYSHSKNTA